MNCPRFFHQRWKNRGLKDVRLTPKIVSKQAVLLYQSMSEGEIDLDNLKDILMIKTLEDYVVTGQITFDEEKMLYQFLN